MNFISFFSIITIDNKYIFNFNYYISRFNVLFVYKNNNIENVIRCLRRFFITYQKSYTFYIDLNYYFDKELRDFLNNERIMIDYNSLTFHKSINIIEIINRILERIIRKLKKK